MPIGSPKRRKSTQPPHNANGLELADAPTLPTTANDNGATTRHSFLLRFTSAITLFIVTFVAVNLLGELLRPRFDASFLVLPLAPTDWWMTRLLAAATVALLLWSLIAPIRNTAAYAVAQSFLGVYSICALRIVLAAWLPFCRGELSRIMPPAYGLLLLAILIAQILRLRHLHKTAPAPQSGRGPRRPLMGAILFCAVGGGFLMAQLFLFSHGRDIDGEWDCMVVMGAAVLFDGRPAPVLQERIQTACDLYWRDAAPLMICSGGRVSDNFTEPDAMRRYALNNCRVPPSAIWLDDEGINTWATTQNTRQTMTEQRWQRALIVTHDYHISRTWLSFRRAGITASGVPAKRQGFHPRRDLRSTARECAAWVYYFFRPLWDSSRGSNPEE
jgi:DUF218 domain